MPNYGIEEEEMMENDKIKCMNCGRKFVIKYDENRNPVSLWCEKCKMKENAIKKQFKEENSHLNKSKEDPFIALAQMKVLLDKTKKYWRENDKLLDTNEGIISAEERLARTKLFNSTNFEASILSEIDEMLIKAKIPKKYLIAENL